MNNIAIITKIMKKLTWFIITLLSLSCKRDAAPAIESAGKTDILSFATNGQTLSTFIHPTTKQVRLEVAHDVDIKQLVPNFKIPDGATVKVNGITQTSGTSAVDFSRPVIYEVINQGSNSTKWEVLVSPVSCKILIDASHDGGVWWFPQYEATGFDAGKPHQGKAFADALRANGFEVTELGRGKELTEEMFFGHYIVIRVTGFQPYSKNELDVYKKLLDRGMNLVFFTDHKQNDRVDELGDLLNIKFEGIANGNVTTFMQHQITTNLTSINYVAGAVITNADQNTGIQILGRLGKNDYADLNMNGVKDSGEVEAPPVMGILTYPKSRVFFIGDTNGLEIQPQPFINNLIQWMGDCF
jgi:hypothetical protein